MPFPATVCENGKSLKSQLNYLAQPASGNDLNYYNVGCGVSGAVASLTLAEGSPRAEWMER